MHNAEDSFFFLFCLYIYLSFHTILSLSVLLWFLLMIRVCVLPTSNCQIEHCLPLELQVMHCRKCENALNNQLNYIFYFCFAQNSILTACHLNTFFSGNAFTFAFDPLKSDKILNSHVNCLVFFFHAILLDVFFFSPVLLNCPIDPK